MRSTVTPVLATLLCVCGCSAEDAEDPVLSPNRPEDDESGAPACQPLFGHTFVMDTFAILPYGEGVDLDGDGAPDNALGILADAINPTMADAIRRGESIFLFDVKGWDGPGTAVDADVQLAFYQGVDADTPPDASNNLGGQGRFLVPATQFDVACHPNARFDHVTWAEGTMTGTSSVWEFEYPDVGTTRIADFRITTRMTADGSRSEGVAAGIFTLCGLSTENVPGPTKGSLLALLVHAIGVQADMDRDGDGLEKAEGNGTSITHCVDGDGTVIPGGDCACDPRIADGFSVAYRGSSVRATIVGVAER